MSVGFQFSGEEQGRIEQGAAENPLDFANYETPLFAGTAGELYRAPMRAFSKLGETGALAVSGALTASGITPVIDAFRPGTYESVNDALFGVADTFKEARDYWSADPRDVGTAGRIIGGVGEFSTLLALGGGNPALAIGTGAMTTAADLAGEGVAAGELGSNTPNVAVRAAVAEGMGTAVAFQIPFFGRNLAERVLAGAGANAAAGAATTAATRAMLAQDAPEQAQRYDPWDIEARAVDALTGGLFGAISHFGADPATGSVRESAQAPDDVLSAVATLNDHAHQVVKTSPGIPTSHDAFEDHVAAMFKASDQMARDEPVTASVDPAGFEPDPRRAQTEAEVEAQMEAMWREYEAANPREPVAPVEPPTPALPLMEGQPEPAHPALAEFPDLEIMQEDGATVRAADALAHADAEVTRAESLAPAVQALAACSLRFFGG